MNTIYKERKIVSRLFAVLLSALLMVPLLSSCGGGSRNASVPPPVDDSAGRTVSDRQTEAKKGLGTGQKVALLAGAAALYYMYNQHKNAPQEGAQGKYYLSKNGRVYYRDAEHRVTGLLHQQKEFEYPNLKHKSIGNSKAITAVRQVAI